jgi:DNA-binding NarL/FixJ family response regulator
MSVLRVAILDDHPAVLTGLQRLIERADGVEPVAAVDTAEKLFRQLDSARADVVILDYDLGRGDGLTLSHRLKERVLPPKVVVYSAYAGPGLAVAARVAGVDAVVDKRAPVTDLIDAVRRVAAGEVVLPEIPRDVREAAIVRLAPEDVPVASMRLAGTSHHGIAEALGADRRDVARRVRRIVGQLRPKAGTHARSEAERGPASLVT